MSNILCTEFQRLLEAAVESRRTPEAALQAHAASCEHCRSLWEQYLLIDEALPEWITAVPDPDLADSVLARLAFENREQTAAPVEIAAALSTKNVPDAIRVRGARAVDRRRLLVAATVLAAAAVVAAVLLPLIPANRADVARAPGASRRAPDQSAMPEPGHPSADKQPLAAGHRRPETEGAELTLAVRDAGAAYLGLANDAAEALTQGAVLLPPAAMNSRADADDGAKPTWVDRVRGDLAPLAQRLEGALDFLIDAFPAEQTPAT